MRALAYALVLALAVTGCVPPLSATPTPAVRGSPTPSSTPSEDRSSTPSPTATPVPTATPTQRPPTTAELIVDVWARVRAQYPWIPEVRPEPGAIGAPAYYLGVRDGNAIVQYQDGTGIGTDGGAMWHEAGHAAMDAASRLSGSSADDLLTMYWTARGYPGTWQQQKAKSDAARAAGVGGYALHQMLPNEMFADTFAATNTAVWPDGDQFPSVPLDRAKMRAFYASLPFLMNGTLNATPLGALRGEWALVTRTGQALGSSGSTFPGIGEIWAVTFAGSAARRVATYVTSLSGSLPDTNVVARQLSPDGKRLVLSVGIRSGDAWRDALVLLELETAKVTLLTSDARYHDLYPAWSPDGTKIAFARRFNQDVTYDGGLWVVNTDGSGLRQLLDTVPQGGSVVYGWSWDGSSIGYDTIDRGGGYALYDLARRAQAGRFEGYVQPPAPATWRQGKPGLALVFGGQPDSPVALGVADNVGVPLRVVAGPEPGFLLSRPRWSPVKPELLYLRSLFDVTELYRVDATDGAAPSRIATSATPFVATWSPNGADAIFVSSAATPPTISLRAVRTDGTQEREIATIASTLASWREAVRDLVVLAYP